MKPNLSTFLQNPKIPQTHCFKINLRRSPKGPFDCRKDKGEPHGRTNHQRLVLRILGYIETKPNGDKIGKDSYRRIVGYYEAKTDVTKDFYRRIVAHGDVLSSLIVEANSKNK